MIITLGLNAFHAASSAALIGDGKLIAHTEGLRRQGENLA